MKTIGSEIKRLSFIIPVKDEQDTLEILAAQILLVVSEIEADHETEIIFVDDGSRDQSWSIINRLTSKYERNVIAIRLRRNFGKAVALEAGFRAATGDIVFTMDADLQDDPTEIPRFLEALDSGYDLVSGWKRNRYDPLSKTLPSLVFNRVTAWLTKLPLHDFNCGFKAYRKEVTDSVRLYGELHRYIPVLASDAGFRITEIEVKHRPRRHGVSKYGLERYARGFLDLITVLATTRWLQKPGHLFGGLGLATGFLGGAILSYLSVLWFLDKGPIGTRPLLFLGIMLCILSFQVISLGVIAELLIRVNSPKPVCDMIAEQLGNKCHNVLVMQPAASEYEIKNVQNTH